MCVDVRGCRLAPVCVSGTEDLDIRYAGVRECGCADVWVCAVNGCVDVCGCHLASRCVSGTEDQVCEWVGVWVGGCVCV